jgi:hypothetical protein
MAALVDDARRDASARVVWIPEMLAKPDVIALYTHAAVFVCPSVYEPFGIINLEAMACETPVVASAVGGIPEIVVPVRRDCSCRSPPRAAGRPSRATPARSSGRWPTPSTRCSPTPARRSAIGARGARAACSADVQLAGDRRRGR